MSEAELRHDFVSPEGAARFIRALNGVRGCAPCHN
jgi:hypothetical protein